MRIGIAAAGALVWAGGLYAQYTPMPGDTKDREWEVGGAVGYGFYRSDRVEAPAGTVTAGIRNRFVASAVVTDHAFLHLSGELRYLYQDGDPYLSSGGIRTNLQGQSHTVVYDALIQIREPDARWRPYIAVGAGAKVYRVSGPPNPDQPFQNVALLTTRNDVKFVASLGAGVSYRLGRGVMLRMDFRDYITPFPKKMIAPVPLATARGIFNQFTPMVGIGYLF